MTILAQTAREWHTASLAEQRAARETALATAFARAAERLDEVRQLHSLFHAAMRCRVSECDLCTTALTGRAR